MTCKRVFYFEGLHSLRYKKGLLPYLPHKSKSQKYQQPIYNIRDCSLNDFSNAMKFVQYNDKTSEREYTAKGELFILFEYYLKEILREIFHPSDDKPGMLTDLYLWYRNSVNNIRKFKNNVSDSYKSRAKSLDFILDTVHCYYAPHNDFQEQQKKKIKNWLDERIGKSNTPRVNNIINAIGITIGRTMDIFVVYLLEETKDNKMKPEKLLNKIFIESKKQDWVLLDPLKIFHFNIPDGKSAKLTRAKANEEYVKGVKATTASIKIYDEVESLRQKANSKHELITKIPDKEVEKRVVGYNECFDLYIQCAHKANESGSYDWKSSSNTLLVLRSREEHADKYMDYEKEEADLKNLSQDEYDKCIMNKIMKNYNSYCLSNVQGGFLKMSCFGV